MQSEDLVKEEELYFLDFLTDSDLKGLILMGSPGGDPASGAPSLPDSLPDIDLEMPLFEELEAMHSEEYNSEKETPFPASLEAGAPEGDVEYLRDSGDRRFEATLSPPPSPLCLPSHRVPRESSRRGKRSAKKRSNSTSSEGSDVQSPSKSRKDSFSEDGSKFGDKCMSKNAIAARENRKKKKMHLQSLEASMDKVETENKWLRKQVAGLTTKTTSLEDEVTYLRGILSNVDEIKSLIQSVKKTPGIRVVGTSLGNEISAREPGTFQASSSSASESRKRVMAQVMDSATPRKSARLNAKENPGVCLHVVNGSVSLEFCQMCSKTAKHALVKK